MIMRKASVAAFVLMVAGLLLLASQHALWGTGPVTIGIQIAAALLMIAARLTFGLRSFHAAANPTEGGIVTRGPYALIRHPIYAAIIYFVCAAAAAHPGAATAAAAALTTAGAIARMLIEERLLTARYPEYIDYMRRTRRVVPFVV
jgi:protein-S-isoprenylcysteine O-methyltransferase Ste14